MGAGAATPAIEQNRPSYLKHVSIEHCKSMARPEINRIIHAQVIEANTVELRFSDGYMGQVDLGPALWGPVFEPLRETAYFEQLQIEDETIRWPNGADFCPDVLRYWCEVGGVRSQDETDAHFSCSITPSATA